MRNRVPSLERAPRVAAQQSAEGPRIPAERAVERALAHRAAAYRQEVRRLMEAAGVLMQRRGGVDPRVSEIVAEAGLSNQAFYRHFKSKDELLLALLDDGIRRLVATLERRLEQAASPEEQVRAWVEGVAAQAVDARAAVATRPFASDRARLAQLFPVEVKRCVDLMTSLLRDAIQAAGDPASDPERDAAAIYDLAMGWMERRVVEGVRPTRADVAHLAEFALRGLARGAGPAPGSD